MLNYRRMPNGELRKLVDIGRNKLCPCGSGIKYKKCCNDIEVLADKLVEKRHGNNESSRF